MGVISREEFVGKVAKLVSCFDPALEEELRALVEEKIKDAEALEAGKRIPLITFGKHELCLLRREDRVCVGMFVHNYSDPKKSFYILFFWFRT